MQTTVNNPNPTYVRRVRTRAAGRATGQRAAAEGDEGQEEEEEGAEAEEQEEEEVVEERGRLCLAAVEIDLAHPHTGKPLNVCTAEPEEWRIAVG